MLQERTESYEEEWKAQGKDVPTENEWHEILEDEAGDSGDIYVAEGSPLKDSDFPFKERPGKLPIVCVRVTFGANLVVVDSSLLAGKTLPPPPRTHKVDATVSILREQHDPEQKEQEW
jgi:hypothetical protein